MRPFALALMFGLSALVAGCDNKKDPSGRCLAEGSLVETPRGAVAIESLRLGDVVYSVDLATGARQASRVVLARQARRACLLMRFEGSRELRTTVDHPFFSPQTGRYERADRWCGRASETPLALVYRSHKGGELTSCKVLSCVELPGTFRVFDIGVASRHHNFLVEGVVVHNKSVRIDLEVAGTWRGTYTSDSGAATGAMEMKLTKPEPGLAKGTATFAAQTCMDVGAVDATTYGVLQGMIESDGQFVRFEASLVAAEKLVGIYTVENSAKCLGQRGTIELVRVVEPVDPDDPKTEPVEPVDLYEVKSDGSWTRVGTGVFGK